MFALVRGGKGWAAALLALALAGCGRTPATGTVTGVVRLYGRPVTDGVITLHSADGKRAHGRVRPDGAFAVANVTVGPARVTVAPRVPPGLTKGRPPRRPGAFIPPRYHHPHGSGLVCVVTAGPQTYNIDLRP
jgi:hypothetical protein